MHKDTQDALERLESQLLAEEYSQEAEHTEDELDALLDDFLSEEDESTFGEKPSGYQNFANGYRAYNSDQVDLDLNQYSDEVYNEPKKESLTGLLITASVLLAGIAGVLIFWVIRYL